MTLVHLISVPSLCKWSPRESMINWIPILDSHSELFKFTDIASKNLHRVLMELVNTE